MFGRKRTIKHLIRKLYDWVLSWSQSPYAIWVLGILAFIESSFFLIPPDVLLMALCISKSDKAWRYALVCSVGSVLGGLFGYYIGVFAFDSIGLPILEFYGAMDRYEWLSQLYQKYDAIVVFIAGFTPIPYKVFTISAGVFQVNLFVFILASIVSRSLRFLIIAALLKRYGDSIKDMIDRYFGVLSYVFVGLLVGGFVLLKAVL